MKNDATIEFRTANADDAPAIARVLEVFGVPDAESHDEAQLADIRSAPHQWRVGVQSGEIVSTVHAKPTEVWVGQSTMRWADIGGVSVLASRQGQGLGTLAMTDAVRWLDESGYGVTRLGGLTQLYSRFGYEKFPRCYIEFPISEFLRAGVKRITFTELLTPAFPATGIVRKYDERRDFEELRDLLDAFINRHTGCRRFYSDQKTPTDFRHWLVYEFDGRVAGGAELLEYSMDMSPFESKVMISSLAYDSRCPVALDGLVKHALQRAYDKNSTRLCVHMPQRQEILDDLKTLQLDFALCNFMGSVASNMVKVVNLQTLLNGIQPELQARFFGENWSGGVTLDIGDQQASFVFENGVLGVQSNGEEFHTVRLSHEHLLRLVMGIVPYAPPDTGAINVEEAWMLNRVFPAIPGSYTT